MREKIKIEIAEHVCLYGKNYLEGEFNLCETCAQYDWTSPAQVRKECKDIEAILALIASEQAPLREALKGLLQEACIRLRCNHDTESTREFCNRADAALKEESNV